MPAPIPYWDAVFNEILVFIISFASGFCIGYILAFHKFKQKVIDDAEA